MRGHNFPVFSTATLPGLLQAYAASENYIPFHTRPERLKAALADSTNAKKVIGHLQQGARLLTCLDCLEDGHPEALEYMGTLLRGLAIEAFRDAEQDGGIERRSPALSDAPEWNPSAGGADE